MRQAILNMTKSSNCISVVKLLNPCSTTTL
ncbi:Uncharacterised protein [Vibrio cholerae]|nr:Uncharacterised protein [Vibrio cholerae]